MNKKIEYENCLKKLYIFYEKNSFKYFVEKCFNYNKLVDYNKNIDRLSENIFNKLLSKLSKTNGISKYKECKNYYNLSVYNEKSSKFKNKIIIDIPIILDNYVSTSLDIFEYLINNKFNFSMRFYKYLKNGYFKVILDDVDQCKKFINDFNYINNENSSNLLPFFYSVNSFVIYTEIEPYCFKNFYIKYLYLYFDSHFNNNLSSDVSLDGFVNYINLRYKKERNINKKRMFKIILDYLSIILDNKEIYTLFDFNTCMNFNVYQSDEYMLKMDNYKIISFISKINGDEIRYGTLEFLKVAYSKYYNKVMKNTSSDEYFCKFYNLYDSILSNNYNNIDDILKLLTPQMDIINKLLIIFSSGYFAYIKFNIPLKLIYMMLDRIIPKVYIYKYDK